MTRNANRDWCEEKNSRTVTPPSTDGVRDDLSTFGILMTVLCLAFLPASQMNVSVTEVKVLPRCPRYDDNLTSGRIRFSHVKIQPRNKKEKKRREEEEEATAGPRVSLNAEEIVHCATAAAYLSRGHFESRAFKMVCSNSIRQGKTLIFESYFLFSINVFVYFSFVLSIK